MIDNGRAAQPSSSPDPTLFSSIRREYHSAVLHLMAQKSYPGLTPEELVVFKEEFGSTAFVCHVHGCERSVVGYSTANALKDHEARHQGQLKCFEPNCYYNDIGFSSLKRLRDHKRKQHPPVEIDLPQQIRRKRPKESVESITEPEKGTQPTSHTDLTERLKAIGQEEQRRALQEHLADFLMSPRERAETASKLQRIVIDMNKVGRGLRMWFNITGDEERARSFFQRVSFEALIRKIILT